jgi:hypothetical protein
MNGEWRIKCGEKKLRLESGIRCWRAENTTGLDLEAACTGGTLTVRIFWKRLDDDKYDTKKSLTLKLEPDGKFHTCHLDLGSSPEYRGLITGLAIEPANEPPPEAELSIHSIVLTPSPDQPTK